MTVGLEFGFLRFFFKKPKILSFEVFLQPLFTALGKPYSNILQIVYFFADRWHMRLVNQVLHLKVLSNQTKHAFSQIKANC